MIKVTDTIRSEMKNKIILILLIALSSTASAISFLDGKFTEETLEEAWSESKEVIYGKVIKLSLIDGSDRVYTTTVTVEKVWKGKSKTKELHTVIDSLPYDGDLHHINPFDPRLGANYVFFLLTDPNIAESARILAIPYDYEAAETQTEASLLRKFLDSKEPAQ